MSSSTRKWRKQQKEYNRRRRQATRRAEEATQKQHEKKREKEKMQKLPSVLGLTAAQGFGRNIFSGILATSKGQQQNYLTTLVREKRLEEAPQLRFQKKMRNKLQEYNEHPQYYHQSKLNFAVEKEDPELLAYILQEADINISEEIAFSTALETILARLIGVNLEYQTEGENERLDRSYQNLREMVKLLLEVGSPVRAKTLALLWEQEPNDLRMILDIFPMLKQKTIEFQAQILLILHEELTSLENDIHEMGLQMNFVRNGEDSGYYHVAIDDSLYIDLDNKYASLSSLRSFLESYNANSGEYRLQNE